MVSTASITMMFIALVSGFALPALLCFFLKKKYNASIPTFLLGCITWAFFALVLEGIFHRLILGSPIGLIIQSKDIYYALYGGLAAGVFEETGRYLVGKRLFKNGASDDVNALMFGAGHGGIEAFYILVFGMVSNIAISFMINGGQAALLTQDQTPEYAEAVQASLDALITTPAYLYGVSIIERIAAMVLHMSFSVVVWFGVKNNKMVYYFLAVLMHAAVDGVVVIASKQLNVALTELLTCVFAVAYVYIAYVIYKKEHVEKVNIKENV